jgi:hypothetical protein
MATKRVPLGPTLAAVLLAVPMTAESREIQLRLEYSGSAISTQGDTNGDGLKAGLGTVACKSNLGRCTAQGVGEAAFAGPAVCPNGNAGVELTLLPGTGYGFTRFDKRGDMVFSRLVDETVCFDPTTGMQFKSGTDVITGGTGRFAGASGQTRFEGTQWPLYVDPAGNGFAAQEGRVSGTIVVP